SREVVLDEGGSPGERTVADILQHFGIRRLQTVPAEFNLKLVRAERLNRDTGQAVLIQGPVLKFNPHSWWSRLESHIHGSAEFPRKAVLEPELEISQDERHYYAPGQGQSVSRLPFVRAFNPQTQGYVDADRACRVPYRFH